MQGFKLIFAFKENPFFTDAELWKSYHMGDDEDLMLKKVESESIRVLCVQGKGVHLRHGHGAAASTSCSRSWRGSPTAAQAGSCKGARAQAQCTLQPPLRNRPRLRTPCLTLPQNISGHPFLAQPRA